MGTVSIAGMLEGWLCAGLLFGTLLLLSFWKGRRLITNFIFSLYIGSSLFIQFPFSGNFLKEFPVIQSDYSRLTVFVLLTALSMFVLNRHLSSGGDYERAFHGLGKKILLSLIGTIVFLVIISVFSLTIINTVNPIEEIINFSEEIPWSVLLVSFVAMLLM